MTSRSQLKMKSWGSDSPVWVDLGLYFCSNHLLHGRRHLSQRHLSFELLFCFIQSFQYYFLTLLLVCVLSHVWCDPMDCSPAGSSVHGISQERILEWAAISFSRWSSQHRCQTCISRVSCIGRWILYPCTTWEALPLISVLLLLIIFYPIDFILHFYLFSNGDGFWFL